MRGPFWADLPGELSLLRASSVRSVSSVRLEPALLRGGEYEEAERAAADADAESARAGAPPAGRHSGQEHGQRQGGQEEEEEVEVITLDDAPSSHPVPASPRTPPRAVVMDVAAEVRVAPFLRMRVCFGRAGGVGAKARAWRWTCVVVMCKPGELFGAAKR